MNKTLLQHCFRPVVVLVLLAVLSVPAPTLVRAEAANLLRNGDFENGSAGWQPCANAAIVDKTKPGVSSAMVFRGRYAVRISYDPDNRASCGGDTYNDPRGQIAQQISVPSDGDVLTIWFRYSRVGQVGKPLRVTLGTEDGLLGRVAETDQVDPGELSGWSWYRSELNAEELASARGRTLNLYLSVSAWSTSETSPGNDSDPQG